MTEAFIRVRFKNPNASWLKRILGKDWTEDHTVISHPGNPFGMTDIYNIDTHEGTPLAVCEHPPGENVSVAVTFFNLGDSRIHKLVRPGESQHFHNLDPDTGSINGILKVEHTATTSKA